MDCFSSINIQANMKVNKQRLGDLRIGLANLPNLDFPEVNGRNKF